MLLVKLFHFFKGYVIILVEGYFLERFINICIRRQIYLWDIHKLNSSKMKLKVSIRGFKAIRPIAHKTRCHVSIIAKKGLPFILHRYRKRKAFLFGIILFIGLIWYMTSFIWVLEVTGNKDMPTEEIQMQLAQCGLKVGVLKMGLDIDNVQNEMMLQNDRLSWIGINVKGTKAVVEVKESRTPPEILEKHIPCNIVAAKNGVIKSMVIKSGYPVVREGDTVEKGQLIISGVIDSKVEGIRYIHSIASIKARTWYEKSKEMSLIKTKQIKTGNSLTKNTLKIFNYRINLFINSGIPYANYDKITDSKDLILGKDYVLPISLEMQKFEEFNVEQQKMQLEEVIAEGVLQLKQELQQELSDDLEIIKEDVEHVFIDDQNLVVKLTLECMEEIGAQEKIIKNDE